MKPRQEFLALANVGKNTLRQQRGTPIGKTLSALGPPTLFPVGDPWRNRSPGARHGTARTKGTRPWSFFSAIAGHRVLSRTLISSIAPAATQKFARPRKIFSPLKAGEQWRTYYPPRHTGSWPLYARNVPLTHLPSYTLMADTRPNAGAAVAVRMPATQARLPEKSGQVTRHSRLFTSPVDGRSREGRFLGRWRIELKHHLGRDPSPVEAEIIDRIAWQKLHLARLDAKASSGASLSGEEIRLYTSLTSGIVRAMKSLGLRPAAPAQVTARQIMGLDPMPPGMIA